MTRTNRMIRWSVAVVAAACLGTMPARGIAVFKFVDGCAFDGAAVGASKTLPDTETGVDVTLKTVDVIGQDGTRASKGAKHQCFIHAKINTMGISTAKSARDDRFKLESRDFNPGEAWIISFDVDTRLKWIDLASQDEGAEMTVSSKAFKDKVLTYGTSKDTHFLDDERVPAGTEIMFKMTSAPDAADTSLRIDHIIVSAVKK